MNDELKKLEQDLEKSEKTWFNVLPRGSTQCPQCEAHFAHGGVLLSHDCGENEPHYPRSEIYLMNDLKELLVLTCNVTGEIIYLIRKFENFKYTEWLEVTE